MTKHNFGLVGSTKDQLVKRFKARQGALGDASIGGLRASGKQPDVPEKFCRFDKLPGYEKLVIPQVAARKLGIENPYFKSHDALAGATTGIAGRTYINFSSYNYLGLTGHPAVNQAAKDAIDRYGTSAAASRLVAGERPVHRELEKSLADAYEVDDCAVFVSGHATNVATISTLFGPKDLVVHDSLIHNSVLEGVRLSGATRRAFAHNDPGALEKILEEIRGNFERVLVVIEGLYSMDGDIPDLPRFIQIKRRFKTFLMVDEAHSFGVLGARGLGIREHCGVAGRDVDIWMGTLSKSLAGCGGYIAGEHALIELLKYAAAGFVYSVGLSPVMAAASLAALKLIPDMQDSLQRLRGNAVYFLEGLRKICLDSGLSQGYAVVPVITGSSLKAAKLSATLFASGINVQPIIYPAVEEKAARLRFFLSALHTQDQLDATLSELRRLA